MLFYRKEKSKKIMILSQYCACLKNESLDTYISSWKSSPRCKKLFLCLYAVFIIKIQFVCDTHIKMHPTVQQCGKPSNIPYWFWKMMPEATFSPE